MRDVATTIDTTDTTAVWTQEARNRWREMVQHTEILRAAYGAQSLIYADAVQSLAKVSIMLNTGPSSQRVMTDMGDLSLFVDTGGFVFGVIWHQTRRDCTNEGCRAYINDEGRAWPAWSTAPMCEGPTLPGRLLHEPSYPLHAPHPGTWSVHS